MLPLNSVTTDLRTDFTVYDLLLFIVVSIICGLVGALFNSLYHNGTKLRPKRKGFKVLEAVFIVCLVTVAAVYMPMLAGTCLKQYTRVSTQGNVTVTGVRFLCKEDEYNDMSTLFFEGREGVIQRLVLLGTEGTTEEEFTTLTLLVFFVLNFFLMVVAYGAAYPSGLFMPIILNGVCLGAFLGRMLARLAVIAGFPMSSINCGIYGMMGATSLLAGVFRSSISLVVILLEGTGKIELLLPIILTITVAKVCFLLLGWRLFF